MGNSCRSSGELTADGVVVDGKMLLVGLEIITDGSNTAAVTLYDNASAASGTKLYEGGCVGANLSKTVNFDRAVQANKGIYLDIGGVGASCILYLG